METLRSNVNNMSNYPNKETMELFLQLGKKLGILDSVELKGIRNYKRGTAVVTLAVICEYLCQGGREKEKESFLAELEKQGDMYYKFMGEFAVKIWEQKGNLSNYSKSMIKANKEKLEKKKQGDYPYFPLISESDFSKWIQELKPDRMIHEEFEAELARLDGINEGADKIQAESANHTFDRGDNSGQISDLENRL